MQDPANLHHIEASLHIRYPNPLDQRFTWKWLEDQTKKFLSNKKSSVRRAVVNAVRDPEHNYRPGQCHNQEWDIAMVAEKLDEAALGRRAHPQQADARARQTSTHYGSGKNMTFKDKYMSV